MGVSIQMPSSAHRPVPNPHRVMTQDDSLLAHGDFCQISKPKKPILYFSKAPVMVAFDEEDSLASNLIEILGRSLVATNAKVSEKIEYVPFFDHLVKAAEDLGVHFGDICKWARTMPNDIAVAKMKVSGKPNIGHFMRASEFL